MWLFAIIVAPVVLAQVAGFTEQLLEDVASRYGEPARRRVLDWEAVILAGAGRPEREKLERVNRFFNRLEFVSDQEHWGLNDYWATPIEFLGTRAGDCEDFSIAKYFTLREMGVPDERLRIIYVRALRLKQAHMVLAYYATPGADPLILDNLIGDIQPGSRRDDLAPVYSFNGSGLWKSRELGQGRRVGNAERVSLWRDVNARMVREGSPGSRLVAFAAAAEIGGRASATARQLPRTAARVAGPVSRTPVQAPRDER